MISLLHSSTSANLKDASHLHHVLRSPKSDPNPRHLPVFSTRTSLTEISNILYPSPTTTSTSGTSEDDLFSLLSRSHHVGRVATVGRHDTDAWTQERNVHDTKLNAVVASSSLDSNGIDPSDAFYVDVARHTSAQMELRIQDLQNVEQSSNPNAARCEDVFFRPCDWIFFATPGSGISAVRANIPIGSCSHEDLSEGRRRVGEILTRCGVIDVSGTGKLPIESIAVGSCDNPHHRPADAHPMLNATAEILFGDDDANLITALADWTSQWVYTLVIQPYLRGNFRFQFQGKPSSASIPVASRIRRVLSDVHNPVQVVIHALWFISTLTGNGAHDNVPFLSVPIFRYLHNNGTFVAEDFMFRTFVTCAMIGDKTVNDETLSTNTWNRLTRIPQVILNATEKHALRCLKWNVVMTQTQWQDTIIHLRSCIKMGSVFDPFAYDEASPTGIMARHLDELINLSYTNETSRQAAPLAVEMEIHAPRPVRHFTHWEVFNTAEWCPKDDPVVNQKPRTIGIAPGIDRYSSHFKVGTTAKDLLDSILGSSDVPDLTHLARPPGTSFCGSLGVIGARFAHTVKIASACQTRNPCTQLQDNAGFYPHWFVKGNKPVERFPKRAIAGEAGVVIPEFWRRY